MVNIKFREFPVLETKRLILRKHTLNDAPALFALRTSNSVMQFIDRIQPKDVEETKAFIAMLNGSFERSDNLAWVIALKEEPECMVGQMGYWRMDTANHRAEIGYLLHPDHWRKGIVSEALTKAIDFGFQDMNLHSISANINPGNDASRQLLIKHSFVKEAYFREDYYFNGRFLDSEIYSLLNPHHVK